MRSHRNVAFFLITMMLIVSVFPIHKLEAADSMTRVNLGGSSYIELSSFNYLTVDQTTTVLFELVFHNKGQSSIPIIDYWAKLKSKAGTQYSVVQLEEPSTVPAGTHKKMTLAAEVSGPFKAQDMMIEMVKWDFSMPDYERSLGTFSIPASLVTAKNMNSPYTIEDNGNPFSITVSEAILHELDESYQGTFKLEIKNQSSRSLAVPALSYLIQSSGTTLHTLDTSNTSSTLQPGMSTSISLSTSLSKDIDLKNLRLYVIKNIAKVEYELPYITYNVSNPQVIGVEQGVDKAEILIDSQAIETSIMGSSANGDEIDITFNLLNQGTKSVSFSNYVFTIETKNGLTYPVELSTSNINLNPLISSQIHLTSSVFDLKKQEELTLRMYKVDDKNNRLPVTSYKVDVKNISENIFGTIYKEHYLIDILSYQRLPMGDYDVLALELSVHNQSKKTQPLLELTGEYLFDGETYNEQPVRVVQLDQEFNLKKSKVVRYILYTQVPYTYSFEKSDLLVKEVINDNKTTTIMRIQDLTRYAQVKGIKQNEELVNRSIGNSSGLKLVRVNTLKSENTNVILAEFEYENKEKRVKDLSQLIGYYETNDQYYFPAEVSTVSNKIMPKGKAYVQMWAVLPADYNAKDLNLMVGYQADKADQAMLSAVRFNLSKEITKAQTNTNNLNLGPYELNMTVSSEANGIDPLATQQFKMVINYEMAKKYYQYYPEKASLVLELVDGDLEFTRELQLEGDLEVGTDELTVPMSFEAESAPKEGYTDYTLNVYVKFNNHQKLLSSQELEWLWYVE